MKSTSIRPRAGRTRLSADARREQLLDTAADIVRTDGLRALTMDRLSERAGVSKGLGYAYFQNAEDLAVAVYDREVAAVYRRIMEATAAEGALEQKVRSAVASYLDVLTERGPVLSLLHNGMASYWAQGKGRRRAGAFVAFWVELIGSSLGVPKTDAMLLAAAALGAADASVRAAAAMKLDRDAAEAVSTRFVLSGLLGATRRRRPSSRPS